MGALAGCGGGGSSSHSRRSRATTLAGPSAWLSSIPDTAAYRAQIAVNDLETLWTSNGVAFPPTLTGIDSGHGLEATRQLAAGSQLGSDLLAYAGQSPDLLGYDSLAIRSEVSVGSPPDQLSQVEGPIQAAKVGAAMSRLGERPVSTGAVVRYTITNALELPGSASAALVGVRNLAVIGSGGRMAAGGPGVPSGAVVNLLRGTHTSRSLASDPEVSQMLGLLTGADVMLFGSSLVSSVTKMLGPNATAEDVQRLRTLNPGLDQLPAAPTFAGYGYLPGDPAHPTVLAVAIYPDGSDAKTAAGIMGKLLRSGYDPVREVHFAKLFAVDTVTVRGDAVVARLTEHTAGAVVEGVLNADMPLFWSPNPKG